ncbi:MAG: HEAT repeat domain-containing protein [Williamsia sp.]|nr:HEAT repeat domain-containing protein [Williamsia sp.]
MPLQIDMPNDAASIELDEYIETIASMKYDLSCQEDLVDSAIYLKRLANNKKFLINHMSNELREIASFQKTNTYGPAVFILHSNENYFLRAVVWNPVSRIERSIENFRYDICHDHNFDILTVGYCGPGYESRGYTYDYSKVKGLLGEKVELQPQELFTLSQGRVALFRAKQDIHIQLPPGSVSVSLNLIPRSNKINEPQYQFDEATHRICRYLHSSGRELAVRLAGALGDENAVEILETIYKNNPSAHVKAYAAQSLIQLDPQRTEEVAERIQGDSALAFDIFQKERMRYGSSFELYA